MHSRCVQIIVVQMQDHGVRDRQRMQKIIMKSHVTETLKRGASEVGGSLLILGFGTLVALVGMSLELFLVMVFGALIGAVGVVALAVSGRNVAEYGAGEKGEVLLQKQLEHVLTDQYLAIFNFPIGSKDIDCVVLGPAGLFAIETKHHKGMIWYDDNGWHQRKTGRHGGHYEGSLKNPRGQVLFGVRELKRLLDERGVKVFVRGMVVFTNPDAHLHIERDPKPVRVCHLSDIDHCFRSSHGRVLTERKAHEVGRILREYCGETGPLS